MLAGNSVHATEELSPLEPSSTGSILIIDTHTFADRSLFYSNIFIYSPPSEHQLTTAVNTYQTNLIVSQEVHPTFQLKPVTQSSDTNIELVQEPFIKEINLFKGVVVPSSGAQETIKDTTPEDRATEPIRALRDAGGEESILVKDEELHLNLVENLKDIPDSAPDGDVILKTSDEPSQDELKDAIEEVDFADPHDELLIFYDEQSDQIIEEPIDQSAMLIEDTSLADEIAQKETEATPQHEVAQETGAGEESEEGDWLTEEERQYPVIIQEYIKLYRQGKHNEDKFIFSVYDQSQSTLERALEEFDKLPAQVMASRQAPAINELQYMKGEFVVKFKSEWPHGLEGCAHCILAGGEKFRDYLTDGSDSIDELNRICNVTEARSVFYERHHMTTAEAIYRDKKRYDDIKKTYPARSQRIPKNAEVPNLTNIYVFKVDESHDIEKICALYEDDPHVEFAHPNFIVKKSAFPQDPPNDPIYATLLYGLNNTGMTGGTADADIDAPEAWQTELGDGTIVAIADTGVDWDHVDIASNIWSNTDEIINGLDSDGNGFIDDIRGWDFTECEFIILGSCVNPKPADNDPDDPIDGHGTHVGGTVGAIANNATASIGVAPNVMIMPVKGLSDSGTGSTIWLANAITYAANNGADVVNNSWGCGCPGGCMSATVETAIQAAFALGVVNVFAAGNDQCDIDNDSPQNLDEVITVSATDHNDVFASGFSNFGDKIDVSAPGVTIYSLFPDDNVGPNTGTSMAAPHVSGVAALILGQHTTLTPTQVRAALRGTADDKGAVGFDTLYGFGRVNAFNAVNLTGAKPVLASIGNKVTNENQLIQFNVTATDPNSDPLTMTATLVAGGAAVSTIGGTFVDNGNGTGTFSWIPTSMQVGLDPQIIFTAKDSPDGFSDDETITIEVESSGGTCGNMIVEMGEECDDGNTISGDGCSSVCWDEICGNGRIEPDTETCDDGNTDPNDGCGPTCQIEICGDSIINNNPLEECDDGNTISGDGCDANCIDEFCGDNKVNDAPNEECDDGNMISLDGCSATCQLEFTCGNGVIEPSEECDDGNLIAGDGCSPFCKMEVCGNNIMDPGEECDDGNTISGDGCTADCQIEDEAFCGDGTCNVSANETCVSCHIDCGHCRGLRPR